MPQADIFLDELLKVDGLVVLLPKNEKLGQEANFVGNEGGTLL